MQNNQPKVTVITITYNLIKAGRCETFLQCVESVKNQKYSNIEHIIIDGASNDGTLELIQSTGLEYYSEPDTGVYDAMNKGIDKANGKYIAFLNSDDFWHDINGIEESVNALEEKDADFSCAPSSFLDENDKEIVVAHPVLGFFCLHMPLCHQSMFAKTSYLREIGKFNTEYKSAADYDLIIRMILNGAKPAIVPVNFTSYRLIGISSIDKDLSSQECIMSYTSNYSSLVSTQQNFEQMFEQRIIAAELLKEIYIRVHPIIQEEMLKNFSTATMEDGYYKIVYYPPPHVDSVPFHLHDVITSYSLEENKASENIPVEIQQTRDQYDTFGVMVDENHQEIEDTMEIQNVKTTYYLLGIPILKTRYNEKYSKKYLLGFILFYSKKLSNSKYSMSKIFFYWLLSRLTFGQTRKRFKRKYREQKDMKLLAIQRKKMAHALPYIQELKDQIAHLQDSINDVKSNVVYAQHIIADTKENVIYSQHQLADNKNIIGQFDTSIEDVKVGIGIAQKSIENVRNNVALTQENIADVKNNVILSQESIADVRNNVILSQENIADVRNNVFLAQESIADVKNNVILSQESIADVKNNVILSQENIADVRNNVFLTQENIADVKNNVILSQEGIADVRNNVILSQETIADARNNIFLTQESVADVKSNVVYAQHIIADLKDNVVYAQHGIAEIKNDIHAKLNEFDATLATSRSLQETKFSQLEGKFNSDYSLDSGAILYKAKLFSDSTVGKGTYVADNAIITQTTIGRYCSIGPNFLCGWGIHPTDKLSTHPAFYSTLMQNGKTFSKINKIVERKPILIGNDVFIGANVTILDGISIGDGAIIGAGAVVNKNIPPYAVVGGVPAKIIKYRFSDDIIEKLLQIQWWYWDDKHLQNVEQMFFDVQGFADKYSTIDTSSYVEQTPTLVVEDSKDASENILERNRELQAITKKKRCFLLATGPSVKEQNLQLLEGEDCFSISNFFLHDDISIIKPKFHFFAPYHEPLVLENFVEWLQLADKKLPNETNIVLGLSDKGLVEKYNIFPQRKIYYLELRDTWEINSDLTKPVMAPQTGPIMILPVLDYMGYDEIYLVGQDMNRLANYLGTTANFYDNDPRKNATDGSGWTGIIEELERTNKMFKQFECYNNHLHMKGKKIYNLSPSSWIDFIEKKEFSTILGENK